jgi:hypothetical protein
LRALDRYLDLKVGRNEPYGVDVSYSILVYGEEQGLAYAEFEIRQDLIADAPGQTVWADHIADVLRSLPELHRGPGARTWMNSPLAASRALPERGRLSHGRAGFLLRGDRGREPHRLTRRRRE